MIKKKKPKLIVCIDGIMEDMISKETTPFLYNFAKTNTLVRLKTLLAFTGIPFTFFSGKNPDETDIWTEFVYSPKKSPFKFAKPFSFLGNESISYISAFSQYISGRTLLTKIYNIPAGKAGNFDTPTRGNIWKLKFFTNKNFICYKWPFFVKNKNATIKFYEDDNARCKRVVRSIDNKIEIYSLQLLGLDKTAHHYGLHHQETIKKLREIDKVIEGMINSFRKKILNLEIFLWSDHGFVDVKRYVNLQELMPVDKSYIAFYGGTTAQFWFRNENIRESIKKILTKLKCGHILTDKERKKYHIPPSKRQGELIFIINPGYMIFPNYYQRTEKEKFRAMHGYAPDKVNCDGIFLTNKKIEGKTIEMKDALRIMER